MQISFGVDIKSGRQVALVFECLALYAITGIYTVIYCNIYLALLGLSQHRTLNNLAK